MSKNTGNTTINQDTRQNTDPVRLSKLQNKIVPVGVIGLGSLFPGSSNLQGYWRDIMAGRNMVTEIPPSHLHIEHFYDPDPLAVDKTYCKQGAFLSPMEFDPIEFGIPPKNLSSIDTSQLLSLLVAKQVLEDAFDGKFKTMDRSRIGIIMGVAAGLDLLGEMAGRLTKYQWVKGMREAGLQEDKIENICNRILNTFVPWTENTFPGLLANVVSGRIANHFDLGGINCTSDAACASSFSALSQALNELYMGSSDVVIVGGADTNNDSFLFVSFSKTPALSPTHDCRPFSDKADGMVLGEGIAMLALKRLDDAIRDGDRIYAVIKGIGASSDGAGSSIYAPVAEGQASALKRCYEAASYGPETVELVEAHGTATPAGDVIEVKALKSVFQETQRQDRNWCALGSIKSQIGHTKSTAATAGIIKAILGLHHKVLPPTIKVERINPTLGIEESPFYVNTQTRPWIRDDAYPRRASVSAFGFGGTNFHVALEEYRGPVRPAYRLRNAPSELVLLSSSDARALKALCIETAAALDKKGMLPYIAKTSQESFEASSPARLAIVATDEKDLAEKLSYAQKVLQDEPDSGFTTPNGIDCSLVKAEPGAIAFLFPGQGSSGYVGMGSDLAMFFSDVIDIWDKVATFDKNRNAAVPLHRVVYPIPAFTEAERNAQADKLKDTKWAQPAVLTTSIAMSQILKGLGVRPSYVGGHSLGEISALHEAGVVDFDGVLNLCFKRAELMAAASLMPGVMTAVFGDAKKIQSVLDKLSTKIVISNYNDPTQVVLSGPVPDMEKVESALKEENVKYNRLPVNAAFHSFLMDDACMRYREYLKTVEFKPPNIPIYSNLNGARHGSDSEEIREDLARQINSPVQFVNEIEAMYSDGARTFIEVGPSHVLSSFVDNILKGRFHTTIKMDSKNENGVTSLWKSLGKIALSGVPLDFSYLWKEFAPLSDPRKSKKAKFAVTLSGANYAKTYPSPEGIDTFPKPNPTNPEITNDKNAQLNAGSSQVNHTTNDAAARISEMQRSKETGMSTSKNSPPPIDYGSATLAAQSETAPLRSDLGQQTSSPWMNAPQPNQGSFSGNLSSYLTEYFKIQKQTAETYSVYQKTMAESHMSFLNAAESSNMALCAMLTGQPLRGRPNAAQEDTTSPPQVANQVVNTERHASAPPCIEPPAFFSEALLTACENTQQTDAACQHIDIKDQFLTIVSDKTGYPIEILTEDMNLEADLGIDSIKRVEIFSAVKDEHAWLPEIKAEAMSAIHTLGDVITFIEKHAPAAGLKTIEKGSAQKVMSVQDNDINYNDMFLTIVADKTGYPKEILNPEMKLESDLGIDSIKRVEIFSAIKDEHAWLPEIKAEAMSAIHTLGDVIAFIEKHAPETGLKTIEKGSAQKAMPAQDNDINYNDMFLTIVADKTGYPKEILNPEMKLESDLGIDSIKRVEIFSAIKDEHAWLPEINAEAMSEIHTLGDVIAFIEKHAPAAGLKTIEKGSAQKAMPAQDNDINYNDMFLTIVADKTGYPKEILNPEMKLESDLGIDSIKRVEIFSAIKDEHAWLPEINAEAMSAIHTLGDVIAFIEKHAPGAGLKTIEKVSAEKAVSAQDNDINFKDMFLNIVADKTGYPKEILNPGMNMESELGIDSIKRVEIFSAIKDEYPDLPEVSPEIMSTIHTLNDAIDYIERSSLVLNGDGLTHTDPITSDEETALKKSQIGRYVLKTVSAHPSGFAMPGLIEAKRICVFDDETGVADELIQKLKNSAINAAVVKEVPDDCDALIYLGGLRNISMRQDAIDINREAFAAAKKIAHRLSQSNGLFVTVQNTGGDFGLSGKSGDRAWLGGLSGLVKSAAIEWPKASLKAIDIDCGSRPAREIAEAIGHELLHGGPETEVGLKLDGSRYRLKSCERSNSSSISNTIDKESIIVVSGGARGVTAKALIQLAQKAKPRLVLLGRTELVDEPDVCQGAACDAEIKSALLTEANAKGKKVSPKELGKTSRKILAIREITANLEAMRRAGSQVKYVAVDVLDESRLKSELQRIRAQWGPVTGLVHAAGVLADKLIAEKTMDQFDLVFNTKVKGLESLLAATAQDPLKTICLFSSIAGRTGNMGQSDYAMANEVLNKVAGAESFRRNGDCLVKSLNWGPWDGGMVSILLKDYFAEKGIPLIPVDIGSQFFVNEIMGDTSEHVEIVVGPKPPDGVLSISPIEKVINLSLHVNREKYPFIDSHRIKDVPVVPMALVLEWFIKAAKLHSPDFDCVVCKNLKVLRGITLSNFTTGSEHLKISCQRVSNGDLPLRLALTLPAPNGGAFYSAEVEMSQNGQGRHKVMRSKKNGLPSWKWDVSEIYKEKLFHGPKFQVIRSLEGVSEEKATCILNGTNEMSWPDAPWVNDVAAIDGGLQLAILWGNHNKNATSLPTAIGTYHRYHNGLISGPIYCELNGKLLKNDRTLSDISFFDNKGMLAAKLYDVELHMLPE